MNHGIFEGIQILPLLLPLFIEFRFLYLKKQKKIEYKEKDLLIDNQ